jgi:hypothetical protein
MFFNFRQMMTVPAADNRVHEVAPRVVLLPVVWRVMIPSQEVVPRRRDEKARMNSRNKSNGQNGSEIITTCTAESLLLLWVLFHGFLMKSLTDRTLQIWKGYRYWYKFLTEDSFNICIAILDWVFDQDPHNLKKHWTFLQGRPMVSEGRSTLLKMLSRSTKNFSI